MRGYSKYAALALAILFVLSTVLILMLFNLGRVVTDRTAVKSALKEEVLLDEATAELVRSELNQIPALQLLPEVVRNSESLQGALNTVISSEWAADQTGSIVDAIFDYFETGDESSLVINLEIGQLLESLRGETGRQLVFAILEGLPTCSLDNLPEIDLAAGTVEISGCMPPIVPVELVANQIHSLVVNVIDQDIDRGIVGDAIAINILDLDPETRSEAVDAFERARTLYQIGRWGSWLLLLIPLLCLGLIVALVVRSLGGFGHWLGWPILSVAVILLISAFIILPIITNIGLDLLVESAPEDGSTPLAFRVLRVALEAMADIWLVRLKIQGALAMIVGLFLVTLGFVGTWMFDKSSN